MLKNSKRRSAKMIYRVLIMTLGFMILWQALVMITQLPAYILPTPLDVLSALYHQFPLIAHQALPTLLEMVLGFVLAIFFGVFCALMMMRLRVLGGWLWPMLMISQAIPTFAIAPLLVLWFGYGIASKILLVILMLFFPIASAFYDGLRSTPVAWLDLATTMNASPSRVLWHVRVPAALPRLASGLRVAAVWAPLAAVMGEWVGASQGLGFLILMANARMQIALMFACLMVLVVLTLAFYFGVDRLSRRWISWEL